MPIYKVESVGFYNSKMYDPNGKRRTLVTDKPLKPVPSWLTLQGPETAAQKKARKENEDAAAAADAEKAREDQTDIDSVTFTETHGVARAAGVETL